MHAGICAHTHVYTHAHPQTHTQTYTVGFHNCIVCAQHLWRKYLLSGWDHFVCLPDRP